MAFTLGPIKKYKAPTTTVAPKKKKVDPYARKVNLFGEPVKRGVGESQKPPEPLLGDIKPAATTQPTVVPPPTGATTNLAYDIPAGDTLLGGVGTAAALATQPNTVVPPPPGEMLLGNVGTAVAAAAQPNVAIPPAPTQPAMAVPPTANVIEELPPPTPGPAFATADDDDDDDVYTAPSSDDSGYPPSGDGEYVWDGEKWVLVGDDPGPPVDLEGIAAPGGTPAGFNPITAGYIPPETPAGTEEPVGGYGGYIWPPGEGPDPTGDVGLPPVPTEDPGGPPALPTGTLTYAGDPTISAPVSGGEGSWPGYFDPRTYEQQWIDPYIRQNLMQRGDVKLGDAALAEADVPILSTIEDYQRQLESRGVQTENIELLQSIAQGQPSAAIEQQRERGMQAAMATAASMRGAPTSAVQRAMNQQMSEVNRNAMEAAAQQQLQAQQLVAEAATQMRAQDMSLVDVQGQYQQQANLTNAQMSNEMSRAEVQINAQLEQQRDAMVDSLIGRGVDRNVALVQISSEMSRLQEELYYKYWAGRLGALTEVTKEVLAETSAFEQLGGQFLQESGVLNVFGEYPTAPGYAVPGISIDYPTEAIGNIIPTRELPTTPTAATGGGAQWYWDEDTGEWRTRQTGVNTGVMSGFEAKENITPVGSSDEYLRKRVAQPFGQIGAGAQEFGTTPASAGITTPTSWNQPSGTTTFGRNSLRDVNKGLLPGGSRRIVSPGDVTGMGLAPDVSSPSPFLKPDPLDKGEQVAKALAEQKVSDPWGQVKESYKTGQDILETGQIGSMGMTMLTGRREERDKAAKGLAMIGVKKSIQGGLSALEDFLEAGGQSQKAINRAVGSVMSGEVSAAGKAAGVGAADTERAVQLTRGAAEGAQAKPTQEVVQGLVEGAPQAGVEGAATGVATEAGLGTAAGEAAKEGAASTIASWAPYIGTAASFGEQVFSGGEPLPAAIRAGGALAGGLGGAYGGGALGAAAGGPFAWLTGPIGAAIGGTGGALAGGAAVDPLARGFSRFRDSRSRQASPMGGIYETGERVGAPTVYSGLETKQYVEGLTPKSTPMSIFGQQRRPLRSGGTYPLAQYSDKETKSGISPTGNDELSDFLRTINPVKYDYKPEYGGEKNQYGIIAQDAQRSPVGDSFVKQNGDGTHMIDTGKATMVNMAALANQQRILDRQGQMIAELLGRRG